MIDQAAIARAIRRAFSAHSAERYAKHSLAKNQGEFAWVTIGGTPGEKGQHEGGTPVKIERSTGKIVAGPHVLADKGIKKLSDFGKQKDSKSAGSEAAASGGREERSTARPVDQARRQSPTTVGATQNQSGTEGEASAGPGGPAAGVKQPIRDPYTSALSDVRSVIESADMGTAAGELEAMRQVVEVGKKHGVSPNELWREATWSSSYRDIEAEVSGEADDRAAERGVPDQLRGGAAALDAREEMKRKRDDAAKKLPQEQVDAIKDGRIKMVQAPKGGATSDVNGKFYKGGHWMPVHGLSAGQSKPQKAPQSEGVAPVANEHAKDRQPPTARQLSPQDIEAEQERAKAGKHWDTLKSGPLGQVKWLGESPNAKAISDDRTTLLETRDVAGWHSWAASVGKDGVSKLIAELEPVVHAKIDQGVAESKSRWEAMSANERQFSARPRDDDAEWEKNQIRDRAKQTSEQSRKTGVHEKAIPGSHYARELVQAALGNDGKPSLENMLSVNEAMSLAAEAKPDAKALAAEAVSNGENLSVTMRRHGHDPIQQTKLRAEMAEHAEQLRKQAKPVPSPPSNARVKAMESQRKKQAAEDAMSEPAIEPVSQPKPVAQPFKPVGVAGSQMRLFGQTNGGQKQLFNVAKPGKPQSPHPALEASLVEKIGDALKQQAAQNVSLPGQRDLYSRVRSAVHAAMVERYSQEWDESKVNRDEQGQFASKGLSQRKHADDFAVEVSRSTHRPAGRLEALVHGKLLRSVVNNSNTGWPIHINKRSIKESVYRHGFDFRAVSAMPQLARNAVHFASDDPDQKEKDEIRRIHYLYAPLMLDDEPHLARLLVKERHDGIRELVEHVLYHVSHYKDERLADATADEPTDADSVSASRKPSRVTIGQLIAAVNKKYPEHVHPEHREKYSRSTASLAMLVRREFERYSLRSRIADAVARTHRAPSDAQKLAGNYAKGKFWLWGHELAIENPKGSTRSGTSKSGATWSVTMGAHYGYIRRTVSKADGDAVDCFIGPHPESEAVFVINQQRANGKFDEHKIVLGCRSEQEAKRLYLSCYSPGWSGIQSIVPMTKPQFLRWLEHGDTSRPVKWTDSIERYELSRDQAVERLKSIGLHVNDAAIKSIQSHMARREARDAAKPVAAEHRRPPVMLPAPETPIRTPKQVAAKPAKPAKPSNGSWQKVGGSSVFVNNDGQITKGCPGLKGEHVADIIGEEDESRERREARQNHALAQGKTGHDLTASQAKRLGTGKALATHQVAKRAAKQTGVPTHEVLKHMPEVHEMESGLASDTEKARARARQMTGLTAGRINKREDAGKDHSTYPYFDETSRDFASEYPHIFDKDEHDTPQRVWEFIKEGRQPTKLAPHVLADKAADRVWTTRQSLTRKLTKSIADAIGQPEERSEGDDSDLEYTEPSGFDDGDGFDKFSRRLSLR